MIGSLILAKVVLIFDMLPMIKKMDKLLNIYRVFIRSFIYLAGFLWLLVYNFRWLSKQIVADHWHKKRKLYAATFAVTFLLLGIVAATNIQGINPASLATSRNTSAQSDLPNIVILSSRVARRCRLAATRARDKNQDSTDITDDPIG